MRSNRNQGLIGMHKTLAHNIRKQMMRKLRFVLASMAALALASCGGSEEKGALTGEPVAAVKAPEGKQWIEVVNKYCTKAAI